MGVEGDMDRELMGITDIFNKVAFEQDLRFFIHGNIFPQISHNINVQMEPILSHINTYVVVI